MDKITKEIARIVAQGCLKSCVIMTGRPIDQHDHLRVARALNKAMEPLGHVVILEPWGTHYRILISFGGKAGYMPVGNDTGMVSEWVDASYVKTKAA